ncbi:uncharacterized protein PG998_011645 [Apiospora kogelbergensis]|uniref:uncharacterized protein n=1 Tax=Apiospora kogelbergensis TaxID=1337665 RepID=UPI00312E22FE
MDEALLRTQPWLMSHGPMTNDLELNNFHKARFIRQTLFMILEGHIEYEPFGKNTEDEKRTRGLFEYDNYKDKLQTGLPSLDEYSRHNARAAFCLHPSYCGPDRSKPHQMCYVWDMAPLEEDALSVSEVWSLMIWTLARLKSSDQFHRIYPITIFTGFGFGLRIVQGYVDAETGSIRVRKSPVLNLEGTPIDCWESIVYFCSWILGDQVGSTSLV